MYSELQPKKEQLPCAQDDGDILPWASSVSGKQKLEWSQPWMTLGLICLGGWERLAVGCV